MALETYTGGGSIHLGLPKVRAAVRGLSPHTVVDFGVGRGGMGRMVRQEVPHARIFGCDTWEPVVVRHRRSQATYNGVTLATIPDFAAQAPAGPGVLWVFGDVLEHLDPPTAVALVQQNRLGDVLVRVPIGRWPQGNVGGNAHETHLWDVYPGDLAVRPYRWAEIAHRRTGATYADLQDRDIYRRSRETWYANILFGPYGKA